MRHRIARLDDLLAHLLAKNAPLERTEYNALIAEVMGERVVAAIGDDGTPVAMGGVLTTDGPGTCWLSVVPGRLNSGIAPAALLMRATVRLAAPAFPSGLAAYVRDDNSNGQRLAAAIGFRATGVTVGELRRWMWDGGRLDRSSTAAASRPRRSGAGRTAPAAG